MLTSKFKLISSALVLAAVVVSPVYAESGSGSFDNISNEPGKIAICDQLAKSVDKVKEETSKRKGEHKARAQNRDNNLESKSKDRTKKLSESRTKWDEVRSKEFAAFDAAATTGAQKAAVATFKTKVADSVAKRRAAVDQAIATYKTELKALLGNRTTSTDANAVALEAKIDAAKAKALTSCKAGVAPEQVKTDLKAAIEAAKTDYKALQAPVKNITPEMAALKAARKTAIDAAITTFKSEIEAARAELTSALK
jgi:hypothetical protein